MRVLTLFIPALLIAAAPVLAAEQGRQQRLDEVAQRGARVMPFALEQTLHIFTKTAKGGIQQVVTKDKNNTQQIGLIRKHLAKIAKEFAQSDFSDPEKIHGKTMPGLAVLRTAKPGEIKVDYQELADGAQITYSSALPNFVAALHQWFDAQLSDHARHAVAGHAGHRMHGQ
jgi:hypothetical protein